MNSSHSLLGQLKKDLVMNVLKALLLISLFIFVTPANALPFNITPVGSLPTSVIYGKTVAAAYTVVNNTSRNFTNIFIQKPANVAVSSTGCGSVFNLAAGASCTLNLSITGQVTGENKLFVCLAGGKTCTGPTSSLNVQVISANTFIYMGNNGGIYSCAIGADSGVIPYKQSISCTNTGYAPTGAIAFVNPVWMAYSLSGQQAYVTDSGPPAVVWLCNVDTITGNLTNCVNSGASGISNPVAITLNSAGTLAYITDATNNNVELCNVNLLTGALSMCQDSGAGNSSSLFKNPGAVVLNPANTLAFIANRDNKNITYCTVNANGTLSGCATTTGGVSFARPFGLVVTQGNTMYVTDTASSGAVYMCSINSDGSLSSCTSAGYNSTGSALYSFSYPSGIAFNSGYHNQPAQFFISNGGTGVSTICNYCVQVSGYCPFTGALICMDQPNVGTFFGLDGTGVTVSN
jgi:Lactonase, 7-bladed beta-propeller